MMLTIGLGWIRFDLADESLHNGEEILVQKQSVSVIFHRPRLVTNIKCGLYTSNFPRHG